MAKKDPASKRLADETARPMSEAQPAHPPTAQPVSAVLQPPASAEQLPPPQEPPQEHPPQPPSQPPSPEHPPQRLQPQPPPPSPDGGTMAKDETASKRLIRPTDPFKQAYWNLDQFLIWLASRDPAAVLGATDRPNSDANPPIGWRVHRQSNVDRQKVEMEAVRAIKCGYIKARQIAVRKVERRVSAFRNETNVITVEFNGEWFTPADPEWFADCVIEGEPALLVRTTEHGRREEVRPRFNPQSIRQLYRAPTLSNICYRLDVENPDVCRFIAYSDVWNWLAECISRQDTLPIDEAGSRAEKTIRYICMNAPKKLTMWGVRKADPDAELKPVTPQAWQVLSINPLYDWATKGDGGPVIWTGLCFDRKQLVAASVTGGGTGINANATLTQADATLSASASLQPQPALAVTPLVTGAPGRPTSMHLVEREYRDRWQRGEAKTGIGAEAKALAEWLRTEHPDAPQLKPKTIANRLRHEHRRRAGEAQK
jgi:hypothetical protein